MATWGNPHTLPPYRCSSNLAFWGDTISANSTKIRAQHVNELRAAINEELVRRGLPESTWSENVTSAPQPYVKIKKAHIDELRAAVEKLKNGDCPADGRYCPEDTSGCADWESITADVTKVRADHWNQLRTIVSLSKTTCICESEHCSYCSDCGYRYSVCNCQKGCYCDNSKYSVGCTDQSVGSDCGSINTGGAYPYKQYPGSVPQDGTVPWSMGSAVPGNNWSAYWTCKCSPFSW